VTSRIGNPVRAGAGAVGAVAAGASVERDPAGARWRRPSSRRRMPGRDSPSRQARPGPSHSAGTARPSPLVESVDQQGPRPDSAHGNAHARLLVTRFLPGELVLGLHRIAAITARRLRAEIVGGSTPTATLIPAHGDWQIRNWRVYQGLAILIDSGRSDASGMDGLCPGSGPGVPPRPDVRERPLLDGSGTDPRGTEARHRTAVREAIGTADWAYRAGGEPFEA
jgi:hypothetical protein